MTRLPLLSAIILLGLITSCYSKPDATIDTAALLGKGFGINDATLLVHNIDSTRNYFQNVLGFKMPDKPEIGIYGGTQSLSVIDMTIQIYELQRVFLTLGI